MFDEVPTCGIYKLRVFGCVDIDDGEKGMGGV